MLTVRERLHLRQVRVLLERQRQFDHDRQLQQLLPRVRPQQQEGRHAGSVPGHHQAEDGAQAAKGLYRRQAEKRRNQRGLFGLQQEDPAHRLAPAREHHRRRRYQ